FLRTIDVTDPLAPKQSGRVATGDQTEMIVPAAFYNAPFLQPVALVPGNEGVFATDLSLSEEPTQLGALQAIQSAYVVAIEEFPLDQMLDANGERLKDISRRPSRWLYRAEIERILDVDGELLGTIREGEDVAEFPGQTARGFFQKLDEDKNGLLTGEEYERGGGSRTDSNGDGRITLAELAHMGGSFAVQGTLVGSEPVVVLGSSRVDPDGDLARLFDGIDPEEFDRDDDGRLTRKETSQALFAALDLNGDQRLSLAELSRHPGELRQLRFGDLGALKQFDRQDLNRGGTISSRELRIADREWAALDVNGDGHVQLPVRADKYLERRGYVPPPSEWPTRQPAYSALPPVITIERVYEVFDSNGDLRLTRRELDRRPDLFYEFDRNGDSLIDEREIARSIDLVNRRGVDATAADFDARWDLDGDGHVGPGELPAAVEWLLERRSHRGGR
ncbi:MAG: hypothetical protein V3T22_11900, partial [Planctomycetota bacterium]